MPMDQSSGARIYAVTALGLAKTVTHKLCERNLPDMFGIKMQRWQWFLVGMSLCFLFFFIIRWLMRL